MISLDDCYNLPRLILRYLWLIGTWFQRSFHGDKTKLTIDTFKDENTLKHFSVFSDGPSFTIVTTEMPPTLHNHHLENHLVSIEFIILQGLYYFDRMPY